MQHGFPMMGVIPSFLPQGFARQAPAPQPKPRQQAKANALAAQRRLKAREDARAQIVAAVAAVRVVAGELAEKHQTPVSAGRDLVERDNAAADRTAAIAAKLLQQVAGKGAA
jgi:hypothetical protein